MLQSQESFRRQFETELVVKSQELGAMRSQKAKVDRERDKLAIEVKDISEKAADMQDELKEKHISILEYKDKLQTAEIRAMQVQQSFELVRSERNLLQRNLQSSTEEGEELRGRVKITMYQVEQLKEDVAGKEAIILRADKNLAKCEKDKMQLRIELQGAHVALQHCKSEIKDMKAVEKGLRDLIHDLEFERTELRKELVKLQNERDILGTQLVRRNDELAVLYNKIGVLQSSLTRGESQYAERLDDIKILKLEVQRLRQEKNLLTKNIENQTDLKQEVIHLQRDLTKERLKVTSLEEEVQTPLNLHRWRRLKGSDPDRLELIEKVHILQRRLIKQGAEASQDKYDLKQAETLYVNLKQMLTVQPGAEVKARLTTTEQTLFHRNNQMRALCAELNAKDIETKGRDNQEEKLKVQIRNLRVLLMEQRKLNERYRDKELAAERQRQEQEMMQADAYPPGLRMLGGGFKLSS